MQKISNTAVASNLIDEVFCVATDELMRYRIELTYVSSNILCFGNNCVSSHMVNAPICESSTFKTKLNGDNHIAQCLMFKDESSF